MFDIIMQILVGYTTTCFLLSISLGLVIFLNEDLSLRDAAIAFLLMPFIFIGVCGSLIIDEIKERSKL